MGGQVQTASDPLRERALQELGIRAEVRTVLGRADKALVELDPADLDNLIAWAQDSEEDRCSDA